MTDNEKLAEAIKKAAPEGSISCTRAHRLAEELKVSPLVIGQACNELKIKIRSCELGCFK